MPKLAASLLALALLAQISPAAGVGQDSKLSSLVESAIRAKEPDWQLAGKKTISNDPREDVYNPDLEEEGVSLTWKREGSETVVSAYKFRDVEKAKHLFTVSTITPVMRAGYKLSKEGAELKELLGCRDEFFSCVGFFTNRRLDEYVESYDAVFMINRVVIVVRAREPDIAQRFALHIAQALRAGSLPEAKELGEKN